MLRVDADPFNFLFPAPHEGGFSPCHIGRADGVSYASDAAQGSGRIFNTYKNESNLLQDTCLVRGQCGFWAHPGRQCAIDRASRILGEPVPGLLL